jgi:hypothetical protein
MIDRETALRIAREDASKIYRDLTLYEIRIHLKDGDWHVDYGLKDPSSVGGGPHYVISGLTGEIISFRYEQ